jgi:hypothetical protein
MDGPTKGSRNAGELFCRVEWARGFVFYSTYRLTLHNTDYPQLGITREDL